MFAWIQRLLPQPGDFFGMFEAHATTLAGAAAILQQFADNGGSPDELLEKVQGEEHRADDVVREVLTAVRKTFLTPFDRSAIISLTAAMDDAIDEMLETARAVDLYGLRELTPEMKGIVKLISEAAAVTAEAVPLLRRVTANGATLHQLTRRLSDLEGDGDDLHAAGTKRVFREIAETRPVDFAIARELSRNLERVTDAFQRVANEIDGIVIDHA